MVVDRFTKMAHFIASRMMTNAAIVTNMFYANIVLHHAIPKSIVSDWDTRFKSSFWKN